MCNRKYFRLNKKNIEDLGGIVIGEGVVMNIVELNNKKEIFSLIDVNEE